MHISLHFLLLLLCSIFLTKAWTNYYINVYNSKYFYHKTLEQNLKIQLFFFNSNYQPTHVIFCSTASRKPAYLSLIYYKVQSSYKCGTLVPICLILFSFNKPATHTYLNNWICFCLIPLIHDTIRDAKLHIHQKMLAISQYAF